MMCSRAIGSLPSRRPSSSGTMASVGDLADDAEQRGLLVGLLVIGGRQQFAHAEAVALGIDDFEHGRLGDAGLGPSACSSRFGG